MNILGVFLLSTTIFMQAVYVHADECIAPQTEMTAGQAIDALKVVVAEKPLTENDKTMIRIIVEARLEGRMLKIAPNFSDNGNAVYFHIITQSECLGGFETPKGTAYGIDLLRLMQ